MAALIPSASATGSGTMTLAGPSTNSNQTVTIPDATGTMMVSGNMPAFSAYCNTNQTIATATYTKVQLNTEEFDTNNFFDNATNYRFQPTIAGYYLISGCLYFNIAPVTLANGSIHIYKNGSTFKFVNLDANSTNGHYGSTVTSVIYLNGSTDYIELYVYQANGLSQNIVGQSNATYLSGAMIRGA